MRQFAVKFAEPLSKLTKFIDKIMAYFGAWIAVFTVFLWILKPVGENMKKLILKIHERQKKTTHAVH